MLKRALHVALAVVLGTGLGLTQLNDAHADDTVVYTQPGDHLVNGRYWRTACEKYSSTVVRCSTDIWATTVVSLNGRYVPHDGWVFNTLTYLPSDRGAWQSNPLAHDGDWTAPDGRKWKTECDTAATGRGGCRSWALANTISIDGATYTAKNSWVINNIVQFATSSIPAVTKIPAAAPALKGVPQERAVVDTSSVADKVVSAALGKVGSRYVYATSGPNTFDCSGLTGYAYRQVGITLPRNSRAQMSAGTPVSKSNLQPGDLVFYYTPVSHVGIYIGGGKIVHAANPRSGVATTSVSSMPFSGAVRVL